MAMHSIVLIRFCASVTCSFSHTPAYFSATRSESQEESRIIKLYFDLLLTAKCLCGLVQSSPDFKGGLQIAYLL